MFMFIVFYRAATALIEECPAHAKAKHSLIERIVRGVEISLVAAARIYMTHHHKEASPLEAEVCVDIKERIIANLCFGRTRLDGILT